MNLLEINDIFCGKTKLQSKHIVLDYSVLDKHINTLIKLDLNSALKVTESYREYYNNNRLACIAIPVDYQEEAFYAYKLGFFIKGVPSRLVFLINKGVKAGYTPNQLVSFIDWRVCRKYIEYNLLADGITIKDVMDRLYGYNVNLLSDFRKCVKNGNVTEYYIPNINAVMVASVDFINKINSVDDLEKLAYDKDLGVYIDGSTKIPVRVLANKFGLVKDDLDLRTGLV